MSRNATNRLSGVVVRAAATVFCLAVSAHACAQTGALPPGAPETAPTTLQNNPVATPALPAQPVTFPASSVTSASLPAGDLGLSLAPHFGAAGQPDGAFVSGVETGGPGAQAGIQPADVITTLDDRPATDAESLTALAAAQAPGTTVRLSVLRNGTARNLSVQLRQTPQITSGPSGLTAPEVDYGSAPFSGTYKGDYRAVYLPGTGVTKPQTGRMTLTVTPSGAVTGGIHADAGGMDGVVAGTLSSTGVVSLTFTFSAGITGSISGTLGPASRDHVAGPLVQSFGPDPAATLAWDAHK